MFRALVGCVLAIGVCGCNQIFGIPDVTGDCACSPDATCTGGTCACNAGFTGDGLTCSDVDECSASPSPCDANASCMNTPGSFTCACNAGFVGDGMACSPTTFKQIALATVYTCGIGSDSGMYCWGANYAGQLGDGTTTPHAHPKQVGTNKDWIAVDARLAKVCGLRMDHSMWCWGWGYNGALGDGMNKSQLTPSRVVDGGMGFKAMSVGRYRVCAIHDNGTLACWGQDPVTNAIQTTPVVIDANTDWTQIASGYRVACGTRNTTGGNLYCFGKSTSGDLGLGTTTTAATPTRVGTGSYKAVSVGFANSCAIDTNNALWCWGNNAQIAPAAQYGTTPTQIGTATDWMSISQSYFSFAGLRAGGAAYVWGDNANGTLGLTPGVMVNPTPISGTITGWSQLTVSNSHICGIANNKGYCWGTVGQGDLGDGSVVDLYAPTKLGSDQWMTVTSGPPSFGVLTDGALMAWGYSATGLGFGNTDPQWTPARIGLSTWNAVAQSSGFVGISVCGLPQGGMQCWGDNTSGQLGIGNLTTPQLTPASVVGTWNEIAIGIHSCGIKSDSTMVCWGNNDGAQLGNGMMTMPVTTPTVAIAGAWLHVAVVDSGFAGQGGVGLTCGIKTDHTLWCWGWDFAGAQTLMPTQLGSDADWSTIALSSTAACGTKTTGKLYCWGTYVGDGTANLVAAPKQIGTDSDWKSVSIGSMENCAVKMNGTLWCWGNQGYLGDGSQNPLDMNLLSSPKLAPTQIGTDTDWASTSMTHGSCAIKNDGSLWCWGYNAALAPSFMSTPQAIH